jgi:tetratricopeptide (TPR) repeat protein
VKKLILYCCVCGAGLLAFSCANPLKGKPSYWYNGYVYGTRAAGFFGEGRLKSALTFYKKGLLSSETYDIPEQSALYRFNMGRCLLELDMFDSAVAYFTASYREFLLCGDKKEAGQAAGYAALAFSSQGKIDSALFWYKCGAITPKKTTDKTFWLMVHGRLVWARDHSKEALAYFDEAYDLYKKQKSRHGAAQMCFWRAKVFCYFGEYDEAAKQLDEALALGDKTPLRFDRWRILCAASAVNSCRNDARKAQWFYERAAKCITEGKDIPSRESVVTCLKEIPW